jgi:hypothetical protein
MFDKEKNPKTSKITDKEVEEKRKYFQRTIDLTYTKVFNNQSAEKLSKSLSEAILIAVGKNLNYIDSLTIPQSEALLVTLKADSLFSVDSLKEGLSQKTKVVNRIKRAIEIFSGN